MKMSLQQSAFSSWWLLGCRRCWKHGWASKNSPPGFSFPTKKEPSGWTRCSSRWELFSKVRTKYMTIILYSLALAFCERVCAGPAIQNDRAPRWGSPQVSSLCLQHNCYTNIIRCTLISYQGIQVEPIQVHQRQSLSGTGIFTKKDWDAIPAILI